MRDGRIVRNPAKPLNFEIIDGWRGLWSFSLGSDLPVVLVVAANPVGAAPSFIASFGYEIEVVVVNVQLIVAAVVTGVGVEDLAEIGRAHV